ncbi:MAG: hypothetical protein R3C18_17700 [Planctomycetaceae bacterium]
MLWIVDQNGVARAGKSTSCPHCRLSYARRDNLQTTLQCPSCGHQLSCRTSSAPASSSPHRNYSGYHQPATPEHNIPTSWSGMLLGFLKLLLVLVVVYVITVATMVFRLGQQWDSALLDAAAMTVIGSTLVF